MPCDTITTMKVNLGNVNFEQLVEALKAMGQTPIVENDLVYFGYGESFNNKTKELRIKSQDKVAEIKKAYSAQVVKSQAKRFGWQLKEIAPYEYQVMKR